MSPNEFFFCSGGGSGKIAFLEKKDVEKKSKKQSESKMCSVRERRATTKKMKTKPNKQQN